MGSKIQEFIRIFLDEKLQLGHEKDGIAGRSSVRQEK